MSKFSGFPPSLYQFLAELEQNNDKEWFSANRDRYEAEVREPAFAYIEAMKTSIEKISPHFRVEAKKVGGSLMRIHRDIRFSKDKSPYKTNVGIQFRHTSGSDAHAPGFYLHISPGESFFGVGTWHPDGDSLRAIREWINKHPKDWKKSISRKSFRDRFELAGDSLKRAPKGFAPDHPLIIDLKRKDFIAVQKLDQGDVSSKDFIKETAAAFRSAKPFMTFLCEAIHVPF